MESNSETTKDTTRLFQMAAHCLIRSGTQIGFGEGTFYLSKCVHILMCRRLKKNSVRCMRCGFIDVGGDKSSDGFRIKMVLERHGKE